VTRPPAPELVTPVPAAPEAPAALAVCATGRLIPLLPGRGASGTACASAFPPAPLRRPSAIAADHRPRESGRRQMGKREPVAPSGHWSDDPAL